MFGCVESKGRETGLISAPRASRRGLTHQDSVQAGYFQPRVTAPVSTDSCDPGGCPMLVGADPSSLFQGYSQPNPVTLYFSGPVGSVTVSGSGAIECDGGTYGTLVGYDSSGVELGRVDLQLIDPADCSPPDNPDNVTFGAAGTLTTTRVMATAVILPMSPLEFPVFDLTGHASATYTVSVGKGSLGTINVSCSGPVLRGDAVHCTASPPNAGDNLAVSSWGFTDTSGVHIDRIANKTATTWDGTLVIAGTVLVDGTINGISASGNTRVQVTARDWQAKITLKVHDTIPTTQSSRPTALEQLGGDLLLLPLDQNISRWFKLITDDGPNNNYSYLLDLPPITVDTAQVNSKAINDTSGFYRIQETRNKTIKDSTYCAQSVVSGVLYGLVQKHEGAVMPSPDIYPNSHGAIFRHHVDSLAFKRFEPVTGFDQQDNTTPVTTALFNEAAADSYAMDHDSRNYVNNISLGGCNAFHYDYSHLR